jgi:hypothetical protein
LAASGILVRQVPGLPSQNLRDAESLRQVRVTRRGFHYSIVYAWGRSSSIVRIGRGVETERRYFFLGIVGKENALGILLE